MRDITKRRAARLTVTSEFGFPSSRPFLGQFRRDDFNPGPERKQYLPPQPGPRPISPRYASFLENNGASARPAVRVRGHVDGVGNPFTGPQLKPPAPPGPLLKPPTMAHRSGGLTPPMTPVAISFAQAYPQRGGVQPFRTRFAAGDLR